MCDGIPNLQHLRYPKLEKKRKTSVELFIYFNSLQNPAHSIVGSTIRARMLLLSLENAHNQIWPGPSPFVCFFFWWKRTAKFLCTKRIIKKWYTVYRYPTNKSRTEATLSDLLISIQLSFKRRAASLKTVYLR